MCNACALLPQILTQPDSTHIILVPQDLVPEIEFLIRERSGENFTFAHHKEREVINQWEHVFEMDLILEVNGPTDFLKGKYVKRFECSRVQS